MTEVTERAVRTIGKRTSE